MFGGLYRTPLCAQSPYIYDVITCYHIMIFLFWEVNPGTSTPGTIYRPKLNVLYEEWWFELPVILLKPLRPQRRDFH